MKKGRGDKDERDLKESMLGLASRRGSGGEIGSEEEEDMEDEGKATRRGRGTVGLADHHNVTFPPPPVLFCSGWLGISAISSCTTMSFSNWTSFMSVFCWLGAQFP